MGEGNQVRRHQGGLNVSPGSPGTVAIGDSITTDETLGPNSTTGGSSPYAKNTFIGVN